MFSNFQFLIIVDVPHTTNFFDRRNLACDIVHVYGGWAAAALADCLSNILKIKQCLIHVIFWHLHVFHLGRELSIEHVIHRVLGHLLMLCPLLLHLWFGGSNHSTTLEIDVHMITIPLDIVSYAQCHLVVIRSLLFLVEWVWNVQVLIILLVHAILHMAQLGKLSEYVFGLFECLRLAQLRIPDCFNLITLNN